MFFNFKERQAGIIVSWPDWSASRSNNLRVAIGPAPALKGLTGAGIVVQVFLYAYSAAVVVANEWPARPLIPAAQVLVATIPKTFR